MLGIQLGARPKPLAPVQCPLPQLSVHDGDIVDVGERMTWSGVGLEHPTLTWGGSIDLQPWAPSMFVSRGDIAPRELHDIRSIVDAHLHARPWRCMLWDPFRMDPVMYKAGSL